MINKCHDSSKLNKLLGKRVKVIFKDGEVCVGVLCRLFSAYMLKTVGRIDIVFYKTHVRRIEEERGATNEV